MGGYQVLQVGIHTVLEDRQKSITDGVDLVDLARGLEQTGCRLGIGLNSGGLVLGYSQSVFIQSLRNILLPMKALAVAREFPVRQLTSSERGSHR